MTSLEIGLDLDGDLLHLRDDDEQEQQQQLQEASQLELEYSTESGESGSAGEGDLLGGTTPEGDHSEYSSFQLVECNGYMIEASPAQRKYIGQSKEWVGPTPGLNCELYCGKIPKEVLENELIPLFEQYGVIYDLRLMMNASSFKSRGYAFVKYLSPESAKQAIAHLNNYVLRGTKGLQVELCKPKVRLFIGNIPKAKDRDELLREFGRRTKGLKDVIIYKSPEDTKKNRGFCFLEYDSHASAFISKRQLSGPLVKFWGCEIIVDWADPIEEPSTTVMEQVKVLYVRNLTTRVTEERLQALFSTYGVIERVKRIKDFAFVHFGTRATAEKALKELQGDIFCGTTLEITWAKPPVDKQKKEEVLRARERRMTELQNSMDLINNPYSRSPYMICQNSGDLLYNPEYDIPYGYEHDYDYESCMAQDPGQFNPFSPEHHLLHYGLGHGCHGHGQVPHPNYYIPDPPTPPPFYGRSPAYPSPRHHHHHHVDLRSPSSSPPSLSQQPPMSHEPEHYEGSARLGHNNAGDNHARHRRGTFRPRERLPADIVDSDQNWRLNSGPAVIDQLQNSPHTVGSWRRRT